MLAIGFLLALPGGKRSATHKRVRGTVATFLVFAGTFVALATFLGGGCQG